MIILSNRENSLDKPISFDGHLCRFESVELDFFIWQAESVVVPDYSNALIMSDNAAPMYMFRISRERLSKSPGFQRCLAP